MPQNDFCVWHRHARDHQQSAPNGGSGTAQAGHAGLEQPRCAAELPSAGSPVDRQRGGCGHSPGSPVTGTCQNWARPGADAEGCGACRLSGTGGHHRGGRRDGIGPARDRRPGTCRGGRRTTGCLARVAAAESAMVAVAGRLGNWKTGWPARGAGARRMVASCRRLVSAP